MIDLRELPGYKAILDEGAVKQIRKTIRKQFEARCGAPTENQASKLDLIDDLERLERVSLAVLTAKDWDDLLAVK